MNAPATSPRSATVSRSVHVAAPEATVWSLASDLPGMGRFSPEARGGRWVGEPHGPQVGAVFVGRNAQGWRRWGTRSRVVEAEPGRSFAFEVRSLGLPVALWRYDLEPVPEPAGGCRLIETWVDQRGRLVRVLGALASGVGDRAGYAATSIETTLERLKAAAEGETTAGTRSSRGERGR